jgi:uncharacterized FlaG/YvyC family protein
MKGYMSIETLHPEEISEAIKAIQDFIALVANGLEFARDISGNSSVWIVNQKSKKMIRELQAAELILLARHCCTLARLSCGDSPFSDLRST